MSRQRLRSPGSGTPLRLRRTTRTLRSLRDKTECWPLILERSGHWFEKLTLWVAVNSWVESFMLCYTNNASMLGLLYIIATVCFLLCRCYPAYSSLFTHGLIKYETLLEIFYKCLVMLKTTSEECIVGFSIDVISEYSSVIFVIEFAYFYTNIINIMNITWYDNFTNIFFNTFTHTSQIYSSFVCWIITIDS